MFVWWPTKTYCIQCSKSKQSFSKASILENEDPPKKKKKLVAQNCFFNDCAKLKMKIGNNLGLFRCKPLYDINLFMTSSSTTTIFFT